MRQQGSVFLVDNEALPHSRCIIRVMVECVTTHNPSGRFVSMKRLSIIGREGIRGNLFVEIKMKKILMVAFAVVASVGLMRPAVAQGDLVGDPARGKRLFAQCMACHVVQPGMNRVGPTLYNVVGRTAGAVEGFAYSPAMKNSGIVWLEDTIDAYLADPRGYIPGNRMAYAGMRNPQHRADVIAYLRDNSPDAPPLGGATEEAPAEEAPAEEAAAPEAGGDAAEGEEAPADAEGDAEEGGDAEPAEEETEGEDDPS